MYKFRWNGFYLDSFGTFDGKIDSIMLEFHVLSIKTMGTKTKLDYSPISNGSCSELGFSFRSFMHRKFNFNIVLCFFPSFIFFRHLFAFIGVLCTHTNTNVYIVLWCIIPMAIKQTVSFRSFSRFVIQCCENHLKC